MDSGSGPGERLGVFIIGLDEVFDMNPQLGDGSEGSTGERLVGLDREHLPRNGDLGHLPGDGAATSE